MENDPDLRLDRSSLTVGRLAEQGNDQYYWREKSATERIHALETCRIIAYGHDATHAKLQRVLEIVSLDKNKRAARRHKDLDDLEHLPD